jgi:nucleotidyltransferase substrate binding protein (TIGR01987 family)
MKDYADCQGNFMVAGSRDASREAFAMGLITNGDVWMEMIKSRNQTSHIYNEVAALEISNKIKSQYQLAFHQLKGKMESFLSI